MNTVGNKQKGRPMLTLPFLSDNRIWIDFIYKNVPEYPPALLRGDSLPILYVNVLSFSSSQLIKVIHLTRLRIQKVEYFPLQVTIFDSVKITDCLKILHMHLNSNMLEIFAWNGILIA